MRNAGCESSFLPLCFDLGIFPSFSTRRFPVLSRPTFTRTLLCIRTSAAATSGRSRASHIRGRVCASAGVLQTLHVWVERCSLAANGHQTWHFFLLNVIIVRPWLRIPSNAEPLGNPECILPKQRSDSSHLLTHRHTLNAPVR